MRALPSEQLLAGHKGQCSASTSAPAPAGRCGPLTITIPVIPTVWYGVAAAQAKDERLGSALGRLSFSGRIGADQFAAGQLYGEIMARNRAVMGLPMDQPRSVTALLINEGIFGGSRSAILDRLKRTTPGS